VKVFPTRPRAGRKNKDDSQLRKAELKKKRKGGYIEIRSSGLRMMDQGEGLRTPGRRRKRIPLSGDPTRTFSGEDGGLVAQFLSIASKTSVHTNKKEG